MSKNLNEAQLLEIALSVADKWRLQGEWRDAHTLLKGLQPVAARLDATAAVQVWVQLGRVLMDEGLFGDANTTAECREALQQALTLAESVDNPPLLGDVYDALGTSLHMEYLQGDRSQEPENEMSHFERGLELRRQGGTAVQIAESLFHVGLVYDVVRKESEQAAVYHQQAYDLAMEAGDKIIASYAIRHLGFTRWEADDKEGTAEALQESWRLRQEAGFVPGAAFALISLAQMDEIQGDKTAALPKFQQARAALASLGVTSRVQWLDEHIKEEYSDAT
jgi:tetratricopeptide (TPR) repeat protein